jgi:hypothetical protein
LTVEPHLEQHLVQTLEGLGDVVDSYPSFFRN